MKECICWHVQNGVSTDFWYDHWVDMENRLVFSCTAAKALTPIVVCDMGDNNGNWNWSRFSSILPQGVIDMLVAIKPPSTVFGHDLLGWRWEHNRRFTTKSAYSALDNDFPITSHFNWKTVKMETDNLDVARILLGSSDALASCSLVDAILMVLARKWTVSIRHITRDQNLVADRVVTLCRDPSIGYRVFDLVPDGLNDLVRKEAKVG
ncbi:hypothetical protein V6N12_051079 [Hibiscus sabdariffa]|uniref:RNase H type-1 domain-containing protein n=1 Tax=Hibiscus sabdariffa TaxID=183260 RepID=A0ABR2GE92_9ROSI